MSYVSDIRLQLPNSVQENRSWAGDGASVLNIYAYVGGDPINGTDPSGLASPQNDDNSDYGGSPTTAQPVNSNDRGVAKFIANNSVVGTRFFFDYANVTVFHDSTGEILGAVASDFASALSAVAAGLAVAFYPTATAENDGVKTFCQGTSVSSGLALLNGAPLSSTLVAQEGIDGSGGFYLATDPVTAEFFAARRAPGTILRYSVKDYAVSGLIAGEATFQPVPQGNFPTLLPGSELVVHPGQFAQFNGYRDTGNIGVTPYHREEGKYGVQADRSVCD